MNFADLNTTDASTFHYYDTGLSSGTSYSYRVGAIGDNGSQSDWLVASATTGALPAAPSGLSAEIAGAAVNLAWTNNDPDATSFQVERSTDGSNFDYLATTDAPRFSDQNIAVGRGYAYRVEAQESGLQSLASPTVTVYIAPAGPSGTQANPISSSEIDLSWTNPSMSATGFEIDRSTDGSFYAILTTLYGTATAYQDTGLTEGTHFYYKIRSLEPGGMSAFSDVSDAYTLLQTPGNLSATPSGSEIDLSWTNLSSDSSVEIQRSSNGGPFTTLADTSAQPPFLADLNLAEGTHYVYRAQARDTESGLISQWSSFADAYIAPAAPTGLSLSNVSTNEVDLSWTNNSSSTPAFLVERSNDGQNFQPLTLTAAGVTSLNDSGVSAGSDYSYEVFAVGPDGRHCQTPASASAYTPVVVSTLAVSESQIDLSWSDAAGPINLTGTPTAGFEVDRSDGESPFSKIATLSADATGFNDTGLGENTHYSYKVVATDAGATALAWPAPGPTPLRHPTWRCRPFPPTGSI